jgi:hypothetical protein
MTKYDELLGGTPLTIPKLIELVHATYDRNDLIEYYKKLYSILYDGNNIESPKQAEELLNAIKLYDKEFLVGRYAFSEEGISMKQQIKTTLDTYKNVYFKKYICGVEFKLSQDYTDIVYHVYNIYNKYINDLLRKKTSILNWNGKLINPESFDEKINTARCLYRWLTQITPNNTDSESRIISINDMILIIENFKTVFQYIIKVKQTTTLLNNIKKLEKRSGESDKRIDAREKAIGLFMESFKSIENPPTFSSAEDFQILNQEHPDYDTRTLINNAREFFTEFITNFNLVQKNYIQLAMQYGDISSKQVFYTLLEKVNKGELPPDIFKLTFKASKLVRPKAPQPIKAAVSSKSAPEVSEINRYSFDQLKSKALKIISEKEKQGGDRFPYSWAIRVYNMYVIGKDRAKEYEKGKPIRSEGLYWRVKYVPVPNNKSFKITLEVGRGIDSEFIPLYTVDTIDHNIEYPKIENIPPPVSARRSSAGGKPVPMEIDKVSKKSSAKSISSMSIDKKSSAKSMEIDTSPNKEVVKPRRVIHRAKKPKK